MGQFESTPADGQPRQQDGMFYCFSVRPKPIHINITKAESSASGGESESASESEPAREDRRRSGSRKRKKKKKKKKRSRRSSTERTSDREGTSDSPAPPSSSDFDTYGRSSISTDSAPPASFGARNRSVTFPANRAEYLAVQNKRSESKAPDARSYPRPAISFKGRPKRSMSMRRVRFSGRIVVEGDRPAYSPNIGGKRRLGLDDLRVPKKDTVIHDVKFGSSKLEDKYTLTNTELGSGATGVVKVANALDSKEQVAVKIIAKESNLLADQEFMEEIDILSKIRHKNIIGLKDKYQSQDSVYLVMELAQGGELFDRILDQGRFTESATRRIALQLMDAVAYLHSQGIMHRDLKPENILFATMDPESDIKISDFGFAKHLNNKEQLMRATSRRGTMGYAAPEIFSGRAYDEKCDMWSLGVILFIMMAGVPPFCTFDDPRAALEQPFWVHANKMTKVPREDVKFDPFFWNTISAEGKDFVGRLLRPNPARRPRAVDMLQHVWFKRAKGKAHHTQFHRQRTKLKGDAYSSLR